MPTGLRVPVGVGKSGGANIETNEAEQLKKLLFLALAEGGDDNPFQTLGLDPGLVFEIRGPAFLGRASQSIQRILAKFSDRVALDPNSPITMRRDVEGEVEVSFSYVDLSTNKVEEFQAKFVR